MRVNPLPKTRFPWPFVFDLFVIWWVMSGDKHMLVKQFARYLLIVLDAFLAVTAVAGGIGLFTGAIAPGLDLLQGSPFGSYLIPGLALLVLVGGSALVALLWLIRQQPYGVLAAALAGIMILGFELVEVLVIGSPAGIARNLQLFYFTLGLLITIVATALWVPKHGISLRSHQSAVQRRVS
jgi:hypothetical protein